MIFQSFQTTDGQKPKASQPTDLNPMFVFIYTYYHHICGISMMKDEFEEMGLYLFNF